MQDLLPIFASRQVYVPIVFFIMTIGSIAAADEDLVLKRVQSHIVIGDYDSASREALAAIQLYPDVKSLWKSYIRAVAKTGDERILMSHWRLFIEKFPEEKSNPEILECLSWAILENGSNSSAPLIRVTAMLGGVFSQDVKGVAILQKGLKDEHTIIRSVALKLSALLLDASLQDEVLNMLRSEKVWSVRQEAIKAVGALKMQSARPDLMKIIAQDSIHSKEKTAAIEAIVNMADGIDRKQLLSLVKSDRLEMRLLACESVARYEQQTDIDLLAPLINDYHPIIRAKILEALGRLRVDAIGGQSVINVATKSIGDPDPQVAVTAAWLLTLNDPKLGQKAFSTLMQHPSKTVRHLAASALASSGKYGLPLMLQAFKEQEDPYIKMNLAIGLIGQRVATLAASECLFNGLSDLKEKWEWKEEGKFRVLGPSQVKHDEAIPNYPEAVNQLTRLEILEILAIVHYPKAQQAIKSFLQESNWGITGLAAALLLTEGDEEAVDLVKKLLEDADDKVKIQAALILAMWGRGEDTVRLLQDAYAGADRELKGQILESLGKVGSPASLTFLSDCLQEPFQTLRLIAASSLLECLYH